MIESNRIESIALSENAKDSTTISHRNDLTYLNMCVCVFYNFDYDKYLELVSKCYPISYSMLGVLMVCFPPKI